MQMELKRRKNIRDQIMLQNLGYKCIINYGFHKKKALNYIKVVNMAAEY